MQWSKLKQNIEANFAESVRKRVAVFSTHYNKPKTSSGRAWITIDGLEVVSLSTLESGTIYRCIYNETTPTECLTHPAIKEENRTKGELVEKGEFSRFDLHNCCWEYLQLSVEEALQHLSPLINLLAILDRRLGKRRLVLIRKDSLHPLVKAFLEFRLEVEGLKG
jgi:hypothetical protein